MVEGRLWVKVVSGHDLAVKDLTGKSDPYCVMVMKNQELKGVQFQKTSVVDKNLNPEWNEEFVFDVYNKDAEFYLEMFDEDLITADDFMGTMSFRIFPEYDDEEAREKKFVLQKGTGKYKKEKVKGDIKLKIQYTSLAGMDDATVEGYMRFRERLHRADMKLVDAVMGCSTEKRDEIARVMAASFLSKGQSRRLVQWAVGAEVAATSQDTTLFRTDSKATRLMKQLCRLVGMDYLHATLNPVVAAMAADPQQYEVDPSKNKQGAANVANLTRVAEDCLQRILSSLDAVPAQLRDVAAVLFAEVDKKFPAKKRIAVAGFFFLRFLAPAIFMPQQWGLLEGETITGPHQRALILLSKVIQNLANGAEFGQKEPFMAPLNAFVTGNTARFEQYIDALASPPPAQDHGVVLAAWPAPAASPGGGAYLAAPRVGARIDVLHQTDGGWWYGALADNPQEKGYFPSTFVQMNTAPGGVAARQDDRQLARDLKFIHRHMINDANAPKVSQAAGIGPIRALYDVNKLVAALR